MCQILNEMSIPYNNICIQDLRFYVWPYNIFSNLSCLCAVIPTKGLIKSYRHEKPELYGNLSYDTSTGYSK